MGDEEDRETDRQRCVTELLFPTCQRSLKECCSHGGTDHTGALKGDVDSPQISLLHSAPVLYVILFSLCLSEGFYCMFAFGFSGSHYIIHSMIMKL